MTKHKTAKAFTLVLLLCLLSYPAKFSFAISGNEWNHLPKGQQDTYIVGVMDGFILSHRLCLDAKEVGDCGQFVNALIEPVACFRNSPYEQSWAS